MKYYRAKYAVKLNRRIAPGEKISEKDLAAADGDNRRGSFIRLGLLEEVAAPKKKTTKKKAAEPVDSAA